MSFVLLYRRLITSGLSAPLDFQSHAYIPSSSEIDILNKPESKQSDPSLTQTVFTTDEVEKEKFTLTDVPFPSPIDHNVKATEEPQPLQLSVESIEQFVLPENQVLLSNNEQRAPTTEEAREEPMLEPTVQSGSIETQESETAESNSQTIDETPPEPQSVSPVTDHVPSTEQTIETTPEAPPEQPAELTAESIAVETIAMSSTEQNAHVEEGAQSQQPTDTISYSTSSEVQEYLLTEQNSETTEDKQPERPSESVAESPALETSSLNDQFVETTEQIQLEPSSEPVARFVSPEDGYSVTEQYVETKEVNQPVHSSEQVAQSVSPEAEYSSFEQTVETTEVNHSGQSGESIVESVPTDTQEGFTTEQKSETAENAQPKPSLETLAQAHSSSTNQMTSEAQLEQPFAESATAPLSSQREEGSTEHNIETVEEAKLEPSSESFAQIAPPQLQDSSSPDQSIQLPNEAQLEQPSAESITEPSWPEREEVASTEHHVETTDQTQSEPSPDSFAQPASPQLQDTSSIDQSMQMTNGANIEEPSSVLLAQPVSSEHQEISSTEEGVPTTAEAQIEQTTEPNQQSSSPETNNFQTIEQNAETAEEIQPEQPWESSAEPEKEHLSLTEQIVSPKGDKQGEQPWKSILAILENPQSSQPNLDESDVAAPSFWSTMSWGELRARITETSPTFSCNETQPGDLILLPKSNQSEVNWPGTKISNTDQTICKFDARAFTHHLPHAMQSVYACWTLWEQHGGHPVLVGPQDHVGFNQTFKDRFMKGLVEAMIDYKNVTIMATDQVDTTELESAVKLEIWGYHWGSRAFFMRRDDAWKWTEHILQSQTIARDTCQDVVRVGILNRRPANGRSIENSRDIMDQLHRVFGDKIQVDQIFFDLSTFQEQIAWFASHDIILTGHGAQETGMPFMPKCGAILEIFPFDYFVPDYFAALSDSTHVRHYIVNNDRSRDPITETQTSSEHPKSRYQAKQTRMCPATQTTLEYLLTAIREWDACCRASGSV
ncbi:hypothetical protein FisN_31Hu017 [Fistulifera solaris]|uniref:Glycosyltransferase 61 catalytic domain-containing protein n=1 Tax=Fistulifera solaris TaxID=1519565 RepID=A0A1Z5JW14_FISSO|nr:hypothetical protein FisN_31Hu017 [Fistulifera solaris]|eukprot:GAX18230.1 hypothetical protein FisN_31Hu017 [Fistulifera solaris]